MAKASNQAMFFFTTTLILPHSYYYPLKYLEYFQPTKPKIKVPAYPLLKPKFSIITIQAFSVGFPIFAFTQDFSTIEFA